MFLKAYTFLDTKTGLHSSPFFVNHEQAALRAAAQVGLDPATHLGQYPADFVLMRIGEFDDNTATLYSAAAVNLGTVAALVAQLKQEQI